MNLVSNQGWDGHMVEIIETKDRADERTKSVDEHRAVL